MTDSGDRMTGRGVRDMEPAIAEVLDGAVDLHVHPGPSPFPRRIGIREAAAQAADAGFKAIVVKSHHHSMVTDVLALEDAGGLPLPVFAGVALNNHVGGVNPYAVDLALKMGARIVWFPTISSGKHLAEHEGLKFPTATQELRPPRSIPIRDDSGRLLPEVHEVLEVIRDQEGILAGGHLATEDIDALVVAAHDMGIDRILIQHPNFVVGATPERCVRWAELGAVIEHSLCMYDDRSTFYHWKIDVLLEYLDAVGYDRSTLVSDLGQRNNPLPLEAYERVLGLLLKEGVAQDHLRRIVSTTATRVLGI